jgi:hypothetical protein
LAKVDDLFSYAGFCLPPYYDNKGLSFDAAKKLLVLCPIPVKAILSTLEKKVGFECRIRNVIRPISYELFCEEGNEFSKEPDSCSYRAEMARLSGV